MSDRPTPMTDALLLRINEGRVYKDEGPMEAHARDLERKLAVARVALEDLVARDDQQEPFNGLDMSCARQALTRINKTETP